MSITVTSANCIQPEGELFGALFPDNNLDDLVSGWLTKAGDEITALNIASTYQDAAALAYVYWRAYDHIALRLASSPSNLSVDSGSVTKTVSADQRAYFQNRALFWQNQFYSYETEQPEVATPVFFGRVRAKTQCLY